jgi:hypothetical protein
MNPVSAPVSLLFAATTFLTAWIFYQAAGKSKAVLFILLAWMILQAFISISGFYLVTTTIPPHFMFLPAPPLLFVILLFILPPGRKFIDSLDISKLTLLHSIRVPVEITLYFLYIAGLIPVIMTFEGNNIDILSGLTAPVIYYLVFRSKKLSHTSLLMWNVICLGFLINILVIAVLAAPTPFQKIAFDHPNTGVAYFPFSWLPSVVVPLVMLSHLAAIRQLVKEKKQASARIQ